MSFDEDLLAKTVEVAKNAGAKELIAKLIDNTEYQIRFSNSQIDLTKQWNNYSLEVFLSIGRKIDLIEIQDPTLEKINQQVPKAVHNLKSLPRTLLYWGMDKNERKFKEIEGLYDSRIENFYEKAPDLINSSIQSSLEAGAKKVAGVVYFGSTKTGVLTGYGNGGTYNSSYYRYTTRAFVDGESSGQDTFSGRDLSGIDKKFIQAGNNAGKLAKMSIGGKQGKSGKYDLIMSPTVGANVLEMLIIGANPIFLIGRMSCLRKKMNQQIGPENISISDNSLIPEGLNSRPFDYEGTPSQETQLIKNGVLTGLIHNTSTARLWKLLKLKFKTKNTSNSYLGYVLGEDFGPKVLAPIPSNFVYGGGDFSFDEIVAESKKPTIYITSNWYTRFTNYMEGSFSTIPRDGIFLIENGEIKKPVRKIRLTEDLLGMFKRISSVGNDVKQIKWWEVQFPTFIPHIKVSDCRFTSATE